MKGEPIIQLTEEVLPVHETATADADAAVVITLAAVEDHRHVLLSLEWSYSSNPTGGGITVAVGSTIFQIDIKSAGSGQMIFQAGKFGAVGTAMVITLAAAGGSTVGKLNVSYV